MKVDGKDIPTICLDSDERIVKIIDQRKLPHEFIIVDLKTVDDTIEAITDMYVRGAPLIGATGAYGMYLATLNAPENQIDTEYLKKEAGYKIHRKERREGLRAHKPCHQKVGGVRVDCVICKG